MGRTRGSFGNAEGLVEVRQSGQEDGAVEDGGVGLEGRGGGLGAEVPGFLDADMCGRRRRIGVDDATDVEGCTDTRLAILASSHSYGLPLNTYHTSDFGRRVSLHF